MSAIAGFVRLDGRPARADEAERMGDRMGYRGPDGSGAWADGPVALSHRMLHTTPESLHERLPLVRGPIALTADVRLDNRAALLESLSPDLHALDLAGPVVTDGALVLAAYARWGERCAEHLLGDFAFALWDARHRRLVCARDHLGVRQLYLHHAPGRLFAFATEPKGLFALEGVEPALDEATIAEHLSARVPTPLLTTFRDVVRLEPAHVLVVSPEGVRRSRYWTLEPAAPSGGDLVGQFAELFTEAVRCRTRSAFPVGAELSGGLDSSAVTAVAARVLREEGGGNLPIRTVSLAYDDPARDERTYIRDVLDQLGDAATSHLVFPDGIGFVELYEEIFARLDEGRARGNGYLNYVLAREASRAGVRVLLTGQDGDSTVGHGWERLSELALAGEWARIRDEAQRCYDRLAGERGAYASQVAFDQPSQIASAYVYPVMRWWAEEKAYGKFWAAARAMPRHFGASPWLPYRRLYRQLLLPPPVLRRMRYGAYAAATAEWVPPTIPVELARDVDLAGRLRRQHVQAEEARRGAFSVSDAQQAIFRSPIVEFVLNKLDLYSAAVGVEARHPFMDVRLIQFCLGLPSEAKLDDGWTRAILRRAMAGDLPDRIRHRVNKTDHGASQVRFVLHSERERAEALVEDLGPAARYLDVEAVRSLWERGEALGEWEMGWLSAALTLALWFRSSPLARAGEEEGPTANAGSLLGT